MTMQTQETIKKLKETNMKKLTETQQTVLDFIEKSVDADAEMLAKGTGLNKLMLGKTTKALAENGLIKISDATPPTYQLIKADGKSAKVVDEKSTKAADKKPAKTESVKKEEDEVVLKSGERDVSKLKFNGELYGKGRLVLAVVKKYLEDNPKATLAKLKEVFPDKLQPRYGMVQEISKAKKLSEDRDRFFLKPEDVMKVGDKKVAVCNQFGSHNLPLKHFKSLGFTIK